MTKEKCAVHVESEGGWSTHRCSRNATQGDYCYQHHPDAVAAREAESSRKFTATYRARTKPSRDLRKYKEVIADVKKMVDYAFATGSMVRPSALRSLLEVLDD